MSIEILPVEGLPEIQEGDDLAALICERADLSEHDVVVVAQKIVSKAEGRTVPIDPTRRDEERARVVAAETVRVVARRGDLVIVETAHGFVCAHAGVDGSNIAADRLVLLPIDPDASARAIRAGIRDRTGLTVAVIVADTFGRPWRIGQTNVALGVAGMEPITDLRGSHDAHGNDLVATQIAVADEIAGAAELAMGKTDGVPVAVVRGARYQAGPGSGKELIRPPAEDLFTTGVLEDL